MSRRIIDFVLFQVAWFACVLGAADGWPHAGIAIALACVILHLIIVPNRMAQIRLLLVVGILGTALEAVLLALGVTHYAASLHWPEFLAPSWITMLWIAFATLLGDTLAWLRGRPLLAALLGAVGGPLSSLAGVRAGALEWHANSYLSPLVMAAAWAIATPLLVWLAQRQTFRSDARESNGVEDTPSVSDLPRCTVDGSK